MKSLREISGEKLSGCPDWRQNSQTHLCIHFNDSFAVQKKHMLTNGLKEIMIQILPHNLFCQISFVKSLVTWRVSFNILIRCWV